MIPENYEIIGHIENVKYKLKANDDWHQGTALLVKNVYENDPNKLAAFCYEDGEENAHIAYTIQCADDEEYIYIIDVNELHMKDGKAIVPRLKIEVPKDER